jgi:hypothetical protein
MLKLTTCRFAYKKHFLEKIENQIFYGSNKLKPCSSALGWYLPHGCT